MEKVRHWKGEECMRYHKHGGHVTKIMSHDKIRKHVVIT